LRLHKKSIGGHYKEKITEDQARDLAQKYADKNLAGFKVVRPVGYGGGYTTVCYKIDSPTTGRYQSFYSVEYSIDAKNSSAETRNLRVDQFGYVTEFSGPFGIAGERGPAGAEGPSGPIGPQAIKQSDRSFWQNRLDQRGRSTTPGTNWRWGSLYINAQSCL